MTSLTPAAAQLPSQPKKPDPLITYLVTSIFDLINQADDLFSRYRAAGVKYHSMPFAVRASTHLEDDMISMLDEVYSLTTDSRLPDCVADPFSDLVYYIAEADRALKGNNQDVGSADQFVFDAFDVAEKLGEARVRYGGCGSGRGGDQEFVDGARVGADARSLGRCCFAVFRGVGKGLDRVDRRDGGDGKRYLAGSFWSWHVR